MVIIGIIGRPGCGKHELMSFLASISSLKVLLIPIPSFLTSKNDKNEGNSIEKGLFSKNPLEDPGFVKDIMEKWDEDLVIGPLYSLELVLQLKKKPFFHLVYIDGESLLRYSNFQRKYGNSLDIKSFLEWDEEISSLFSLKTMRKLAGFELENKGDLSEFLKSIEKSLNYIKRPRKPSWDQYFMNIAFTVRSRSNCMRKTSLFSFYKDILKGFFFVEQERF